MSKPIKAYWPQCYEDILDFQELAKTLDAEIQLLKTAIDQMFDDQFILTSEAGALKRREKMLKIQADTPVESLDFRKKRVINRYSTKPPFTLRYLQGRLDYLVGENKAVANVDSPNFTLFVKAAIEDAPLFKEVEQTVKTVKPANLIYQQSTALNDRIALEEHIKLRELNRQTRLGTTWRLGVTPFALAEPEVIVK